MISHNETVKTHRSNHSNNSNIQAWEIKQFVLIIQIFEFLLIRIYTYLETFNQWTFYRVELKRAPRRYVAAPLYGAAAWRPVGEATIRTAL